MDDPVRLGSDLDLNAEHCGLRHLSFHLDVHGARIFYGWAARKYCPTNIRCDDTLNVSLESRGQAPTEVEMRSIPSPERTVMGGGFRGQRNPPTLIFMRGSIMA